MKIGIAVVSFLVVVALLLGAVGWYFAGRVLIPAPYDLAPEFEVLDYRPDDEADEGGAGDAEGRRGEVVLPAPPDEPSQFERTRVEGVYNLLWRGDAPSDPDGGYGRLGSPRTAADGSVLRDLTTTVGEPPRPGDPARLDLTVFRRDPLADHGIPFETVRLESDVELVGWWIDGAEAGGDADAGETAVLMLHGRRRGDVTETLRILPTLVDMGYPVLAVAHRNHRPSDPAPDGLYRYGYTEWRDALAGVTFLRERGVRRVVIYAFSYGSLLALEALERWPDAEPEPVALVLDSPLLDPRTVVRRGAEALGLPLPGRLTDLALTVARWRAGVRWRELDQRIRADELELPLLLFAGVADSTIPISLVDDFADRIRAPLDYRRFSGVEHVEAWNADPERYEAAVRGWLGRWAPVDHGDAAGAEEGPDPDAP